MSVCEITRCILVARKNVQHYQLVAIDVTTRISYYMVHPHSVKHFPVLSSGRRVLLTRILDFDAMVKLQVFFPAGRSTSHIVAPRLTHRCSSYRVPLRATSECSRSCARGSWMLTWVGGRVFRPRWLGVIPVNCQSSRLELRGTGDEFLQARLGSCLETTAVNLPERAAACG